MYLLDEPRADRHTSPLGVLCASRHRMGPGREKKNYETKPNYLVGSTAWLVKTKPIPERSRLFPPDQSSLAALPRAEWGKADGPPRTPASVSARILSGP